MSDIPPIYVRINFSINEQGKQGEFDCFWLFLGEFWLEAAIPPFFPHPRRSRQKTCKACISPLYAHGVILNLSAGDRLYLSKSR
jgi:hypothetical protein